VTGLRRTLVVIALAVVTVLATTALPAQAAFDDSAATTLTTSTLTVAAPAGVQAGARCWTTNWSYTYNGTTTTGTTTTMRATVSWTASQTRGVSGYAITAHFPDGTSYPITTVGANTTSVTQDVDGSYSDQGIRVSVTTLTSYGWTASSAKTGAIRC